MCMAQCKQWAAVCRWEFAVNCLSWFCGGSRLLSVSQDCSTPLEGEGDRAQTVYAAVAEIENEVRVLSYIHPQ